MCRITLYSSHFCRAMLLVVLAFSGCWEEVPYVAREEPIAGEKLGAAPATDAAPVDSRGVGNSQARMGNLPPDAAAASNGELPFDMAQEPAVTPAIMTDRPLRRESMEATDRSVPASIPTDRYTAPPPARSALPDLFGPAAPQRGNEVLDADMRPVAEPPGQMLLTADQQRAGAGPAANQPAISNTGQGTGPSIDQPVANAGAVPLSIAQSRRAAWLLGSKWSLAVLADENGAAAESVATWMGQSRALAGLLGITLADLSSADGAGEVARRSAIDKLLLESRALSKELTQRYGPDHASLFDVAVKSNVLLALYEPGSPAAQSTATAIRQAGSLTKLSGDLWLPLLTAINNRASKGVIEQTVFQMHEAVDNVLARAVQR